ncbi:hypothetical protein D3C75_460290 [compost metagenome]
MLQALCQFGVNIFLLPCVEHLLAEVIFTQSRNVMDFKIVSINLTSDINGSVKGIATKAAANFRTFLRQFNHTFTDDGDFARWHSSRPELMKLPLV